MRMVNWNSTVLDGAFPGSQSASHSEKRLESTRKAVAAFHPDLDWNVMVMVMIMSINIDLLDWFLSFVSLFSFLIWFDLIFFLYWIGLMAIPRTRTRAPYRICACPISPTDRAPNPLRYKIERESSLQNRTLELIFIFILLPSLFPLVPLLPRLETGAVRNEWAGATVWRRRRRARWNAPATRTRRSRGTRKMVNTPAPPRWQEEWAAASRSNRKSPTSSTRIASSTTTKKATGAAAAATATSPIRLNPCTPP